MLGSTPVVVSASLSKDITSACAALKAWNGKQDNDSKGGALLRELPIYLIKQRC
ncbi:peptidase S45 [Shewanella putrefaciens]|nr:peptidase S45 [Shewanella putrefaciens]